MSAFLGFCHVSGGDAPSRLVAAAFCAARPQFEALVAAALAAQGYRLDRAENVLPAGPWTARHPTADGEALARLVHPERHVAFGPMTPLGGADAPWEKARNWPHVQELGPVTPLDAQFGVHPKKFVPDALQDVLFGQPELSEAERAAYGADIPPLATYAVLDAAKMPYLLTSLLETSGLRYQSLFQGEAQEELGEYAPYLVELKDGHDFTRRLFTGPDGIGGLWEKELGIILRSRATLKALRNHLRKFTRVQDDKGKWHYFRFWQPLALPPYLRAIANDAERVAQWMNGSACSIQRIIACDPVRNIAHIAEPAPLWNDHQATDAPSGMRRVFRLDSREKDAFRHHVWLHFLERLAVYLSEKAPGFSGVGRDIQLQHCQALASRAYAVGFGIEKAVADFCLAAALYPGGQTLEADPDCRPILNGNMHQIDKAEALLALARSRWADTTTTTNLGTMRRTTFPRPAMLMRSAVCASRGISFTSAIPTGCHYPRSAALSVLCQPQSCQCAGSRPFSTLRLVRRRKSSWISAGACARSCPVPRVSANALCLSSCRSALGWRHRRHPHPWRPLPRSTRPPPTALRADRAVLISQVAGPDGVDPCRR